MPKIRYTQGYAIHKSEINSGLWFTSPTKTFDIEVRVVIGTYDSIDVCGRVQYEVQYVVVQYEGHFRKGIGIF